jgi:electron transfer flavoprotein beta subunit
MKAKNKPLADIDPAEFGINLEPRLKILKTQEPTARKSGVKVGSIAELVTKLRDEAGVL